jgi:transposase
VRDDRPFAGHDPPAVAFFYSRDRGGEHPEQHLANWTFAGSDEGGRRAAAIYTLIATAKLNDVDPQAWLADVLAGRHDTAYAAQSTILAFGRRNCNPPSHGICSILALQQFV